MFQQDRMGNSAADNWLHAEDQTSDRAKDFNVLPHLPLGTDYGQQRVGLEQLLMDSDG